MCWCILGVEGSCGDIYDRVMIRNSKLGRCSIICGGLYSSVVLHHTLPFVDDFGIMDV